MLRSLFSKPYSQLYIAGDNADWAIDEEAKALSKTAAQIGLESSIVKRAWLNVPQIVHYSSQFALLNPKIYKSRHKISLDYFHGKPSDGESYAKCFEALKNRKEIASVRVSNTGMEQTLIEAGVPKEKIHRIAIGVDLNLFHPTNDEKKTKMREKLGIPQNAVVIGSFQKDGVGWGDGEEPKLIKGPDIFIKTIEKLSKEIPYLFVLLSGPSRGYVKKALTRLNIPFKHEYLKDYAEISNLYDALDLYLITSREEGGPKACLESMAKGIPLVTTAMGQCLDLVKPGENALMAPVNDIEKLAELATSVIKDENLKNHIVKNGFQTARENSLEAQAPLWREYFDRLRIEKNVAFFHEFHKPPYGGGNQFLLALEKELVNRGLKTKRNSADKNTSAILFNSFNFDFDKLSKLKSTFSPVMVHRVDGPVSVYRGESREIDEKIWKMNHDLADKTIFQSQYSFNKHLEMGLNFKEASVIPNACDPMIFNTEGRKTTPKAGEKIKLIATSWSDNPKKGGPILAWLDEHLDPSKFELTFVGRTQAELKNAKTIPAVPSEGLAQILKQHDIYIAPSQDDPCSNALIEALSSGLPAVYLNSGGHPELVKEGGAPFTSTEDLIQAIEKVAENYSSYQDKIKVTSLSEVGDKYLAILK